MKKEELIKELEKIKEWPELTLGVGEGLGQLGAAGMYLQYTFDRNEHKRQIEELIKKIT